MSERKAMDRLTNFVMNEDGELTATPEMKKVIDIMQKHTDVPLNIQPYNAVQAENGIPRWGSGSGHATPGGEAFVDPFGHPTIAAHEAAHQGFTTDLVLSGAADKKRKELFENKDNFSQSMHDKGATMRALFETGTKARMLEEANAQGIAQRAMELAGLETDTSGWQDMKAYPLEHRFGGRYNPETSLYKQHVKPSINDFTEGELSEFMKMQKSATPVVNRQFDIGYSRL